MRSALMMSAIPCACRHRGLNAANTINNLAFPFINNSSDVHLYNKAGMRLVHAGTKKETADAGSAVSFFLSVRGGGGVSTSPLQRQLVFLDYATLLDASLLAGEVAKVVELCAAYFTVLVDCDRVDEG